MDPRNAARNAITAQINALRTRRNETTAASEKAALGQAIADLQDSRNAIDEAANDAIGAEIGSLIEKLEAVRTSHNLDAVSALGRSVKRIREATGAA